jgi:CHAT domain-containing protein
VPFAALIDREGRYLLDRFDLGYVVSHAQLARPARSPRYRRALVLRGADESGRTMLPHADRECADVAGHLARSGCAPLADRDGLRALRAADVVHYAGHAAFDERQGMAAALCLPGRQLQAVDLLALRLPRAPLVVLSGCQTGRVATRGDEFVGFVRSLFAAGASSVVASSWVAHDEGTTTLMRSFYEELLSNRLSPSAALSAAARRLRHSGGRWAHPFYWANFRCYGAD